MKKCKICKSNMILVISREKTNQSNYIWRCTNIPDCKYNEDTWLKNIYPFWGRSHNFNSLRNINEQDIPPDVERHYAIYKHTNYKDDFSDINNYNIETNLGFKNSYEMYFWFCSQRLVISHSPQNYLPVGSPYYFTFINMASTLNKENDFILDKILSEKKELILSSVEPWLIVFEGEKIAADNRKKSNAFKVEAEHREAVERKKRKASVNIYRAIKNGDVKAITALLNRGIDIHLPNDEGVTAYEYAKSFNNANVLTLLLEYNNKKSK